MRLFELGQLNREYSKGLSTLPCRAPVLKATKEDMFLTLHTCRGLPVRKSKTKLHRMGPKSRSLSLDFSLVRMTMLSTEVDRIFPNLEKLAMDLFIL